MLEDCLIESRSSVRRKNPLTLVVSVVTHGSLIAALILIPLFQEQLLPHIAMFEPLPPPMAPPRAVELVPTPQQSAPAQAPARGRVTFLIQCCTASDGEHADNRMLPKAHRWQHEPFFARRGVPARAAPVMAQKLREFS